MKKNILAINSINYVRNKTINNYLKRKNNLLEVNYKGNFFYKNINILKTIFSDFDLILINWNSWSSFFMVKLINIFKNKPIIYDAYTLIYEDYTENKIKKNFLFDFFYRNIEKFIYSNCKILITDTVVHKKKLQKLLKNKKEILTLNVSQRNLLLSKKKINNSKIQLLHAGADRKLHGINKMIYLIHKLPNNLKKNIHLKIICNDYLNDYKNQITKLKCEDQIRLIKPLSYKNYFKMIKNADICMGLFGNTEKTESVVSNFIVTSANLGKVIITKKTKAAQIYLNENMGIFLLKKPDELNFKNFIKKYLSSKKFQNKIKFKSKHVFLKNFEIENNLKRFEKQLKNFFN